MSGFAVTDFEPMLDKAVQKHLADINRLNQESRSRCDALVDLFRMAMKTGIFNWSTNNSTSYRIEFGCWNVVVFFVPPTSLDEAVTVVDERGHAIIKCLSVELFAEWLADKLGEALAKDQVERKA